MLQAPEHNHLHPWAGRPKATPLLAEPEAWGLRPDEQRRVRALVLILIRPWRSMAKYGLRGYLYSWLDAGHAATNLGLYGDALGLAATVHLRFDRRRLGDALGLHGRCREVAVAVAFDAGPGIGGMDQGDLRSPGGGYAGGWEPPRPALDLPSVDEEEAACWRRLAPLLTSAVPIPSPAAVPRAANPLVEPAAWDGHGQGAEPAVVLPRQPPGPALSEGGRAARELAEVIHRRRSPAGFLSYPLSRKQLAEILAPLQQEAPVTDSPSTELRLLLLARRVEGMAGPYAYSPARHALLPLTGPAGRRRAARQYDFRPACMGQEVVREAAALILFTAPMRSLLASHGHGALAELHFHAAQLAQRLQLAATAAGLGLTCLGGFDEVQCARLAALTPAQAAGGEETIYVAAVGQPDPAAKKHDRLAIAWSHGFALTAAADRGEAAHG